MTFARPRDDNRRGQEVDATSVLLLLTLDVRRGDRVVIRGMGDDALEAVDQLATLLGDGPG